MEIKMEEKTVVKTVVNEDGMNQETEVKHEEGFFEKVKAKVSEKKAQFKEFLGKHPELIVPLIVSGITIGRGVAGMVSEAGRCDENCLVTDDVTGLKYLTTHPLTNGEIMELSELKRSGIATGDALDDMKVLKNERKRK